MHKVQDPTQPLLIYGVVRYTVIYSLCSSFDVALSPSLVA